MYRTSLISPAFPGLLSALRLSVLPDVVVPQLERMTANMSSWRQVDDHYELSLAVPGLAPSDIGVDIQDRVITVSVSSDNQKTVFRTRVPQYADPATLKANLCRGLLTLRLAQAEELKPRTIEVVEIQEPVSVSVPAQQDQEVDQA